MTLTGDRNRCTVCSLYFNSTAAFDKHRVGAYGKDRRCLPVIDMVKRGMVQNAHGFWCTKANPLFSREAA